MNLNRQKIIKILYDNNIRINGHVLDGSMYLYKPELSTWGIYEDIVANPVPFLVFLVKLLEFKKQFENT